MLSRIVEGSARNPMFVALGVSVLVAWGLYAVANTPLDAIPDLSDVQVIVFTEYPGQAPRVVEDQVTYPLSTAMLGVPFAEVVRGYSFFGLSFVYVIFEDGTDLYWARSRVLESLNFISNRLPEGVTPTLGPDATGVGWIYEYALVDRTGNLDLSELRSLQDWYLRYELQTVPGVSEVASVGGYVRQYQVEVDPNKLAAYQLSIGQIRHAIRRSNSDVGGRLIEMAESEFMIRVPGYIRSVEDLEIIAVGADDRGTPILLRSVASIHLGPELRRGVTDLDGEGEVVAGIVIMRFGENALETIRSVKKKLAELAATLPDGVEVITVYDRAPLIERAVSNLQQKLLQQGLIVALICFVFLVHVRSAIVAILVLPLGFLFSFIVMYHQGINANIMSLGGIAIAMGTMIDAGIVMVENAHKHLERDGGSRPRAEILIDAAKEVGPSLFFSLVIITVSFLPIFALEAQEGRLFKPLAYTKTYAMAGAALLSITVVPALMIWLVRGRILPEARNPLNVVILRVYGPVLRKALKHRWWVLGVALLALVPDFLVWSIQIRADQLAIAAAMWGGVALMASRRVPGWASAAGLLFGLGTLSSQKAVYLIALFGLLAAADVWRARERQFTREGLRCVLCFSAMGMVIVGFYTLMPQIFGAGAEAHANALSAPLPALTAESAGNQLKFQLDVFDYYRSTIGYSQYVEMLPTLGPQLCLAGLMAIATLRLAVRRRLPPFSLVVAWAVMALGLAVGLFHAGAFKYFWMTLGVFPAVALVLARESVEALLDSWGQPLRRGAVVLFWCVLIVPALVQSVQLLSDTQEVQRQTFDFARSNFEPYEAGFHAEAGLFCSDDANQFPAYFSQLIERKFGAAAGCAECAPNLIREFEQKQVKYVVASFRLTQFPPIVQTFWQENYLPYHGSLMVAGKFLKADRDQGHLELVIDGDYLWLPNKPPAEVTIDGKLVRTGERVTLARGGHEVRFSDRDTAGMLVLAMDGPPQLPLRQFYRDF
ncbi:MAG: efflux RND transporter permease subunit [Myxococcales bacterium]|nr:efflux RND transporter permease subunit [Myxococcales bacterium]